MKYLLLWSESEYLMHSSEATCEQGIRNPALAETKRQRQTEREGEGNKLHCQLELIVLA